MSMNWNGVEIPHAPRIRHLTTWERINNALEDDAMWLILPCVVIGWLAGLPFA